MRLYLATEKNQTKKNKKNLKLGLEIGVRIFCCNPSLGLAKGCKVVSQEGSLGIMPHAFGSARKCEGIDPHTPKGPPTLGVGVPVDSRMFRE